MAEQQGWCVCRKCGTICYSELPGVCVDKQAHDFAGSRWYGLSTSPPAGVHSQGGWRWCKQCQSLHHPGEGLGTCRGGVYHDTAGSGEYFLAIQPYPSGGQTGWFYCIGCHVLHHVETDPGPCITGGPHSTVNSAPYSLLLGHEPRRSRPSHVQHGWRRCQKCHTAVFGGLVGVCAAGGRHHVEGSAWYGVPVAPTLAGVSQEGWRWCSKCQTLHHPGLGAGLCPTGGGHESAGSGPYRLAIQPYLANGEDGWRYCTKCHALHLRGPAPGVCPTGGDHHDAGSLGYSMHLAPPAAPTRPPTQPGWRRCHKCQSSCYGGLPGRCTAGGTHDFQGSPWYAMPLAAPSGTTSEAGWKWCRKCQVLHNPRSGAGTCPADGGHDPTGSGAYIVASAPYAADGEDGWRFCGKCFALVFDPGAGACPVGGQHHGEASLPYSMMLAAPGLVPAQPGWRRCATCHAICYAGLPGVCTHGGEHDLKDSPPYTLSMSTTVDAPGQDGWRWCSQCQALHHPGEGPGRCPATGAGHQTAGSAVYNLAHAPYPAGGQDGWRYCTPCHVLHRDGDGPGKCAAGGVHDPTRSLPYSLRLGGALTSRCELITDYDQHHEPESRFDVTLTLRAADGSLRRDAEIAVVASAPVNVLIEDRGTIRYQGLGAAPVVFHTSATGKVRFTVLPPADGLSVPTLSARSDDMAADQWIDFKPDADLHRKLSGLTGAQITATPPGKHGPLLPPSRLADANSLAGGVSRVITPFVPKPSDDVPEAVRDAISDAHIGFTKSIPGLSTLVDLGKRGVDGASSLAGDAANGIASAVRSVTDVATDVANTIASASQYAVGSAAQVLDTVGAAAQILIKNAASAAPRLIDDFASTAIPAATQLAVDVKDQVVVIALIVKDGVQSIVKTVVDTVESAAMIAAAFIRRVGLTIKAVIDFLASLLDWGAILDIQADLKTKLDACWNGFPALVQQQRDALPGLLAPIAALIANLGEGSGQGSGDSPAKSAVWEVGGQFGYLMGRLESALSSGLQSAMSGLGGFGDTLASALGNAAEEIQSFTVALVSSPLAAALSDPAALLAMGAEAVLDLIRPLAAGALAIVTRVLDAVLSIAPAVASALRQVLQQRISIPLLTDFIELVVFRRKQELSLESLLTLVAAAFIHCAQALFSAASSLVSFGDSGEIDRLAVLALILTLLQAILNGAAIYAGGPAADSLTAIGSLFGLVTALVSPPHAVSRDSFLIGEQWANWVLNLGASVVQLVDGVRKASKMPDMKVLGKVSVACGTTILLVAISFNTAAMAKNYGDGHLASLNLGAQMTSGLNDIGPLAADEFQSALTIATSLASMGIGIETIRYSVNNPAAKLG